MSARQKLILILPTRSSFMKIDEEILGGAFQLRTVHLAQDGSRLDYVKGILSAMKILLTADYGKTLIWFADYHAAPAALISRLRGRKCYIFIGGYDAACYPELGYGVYCSPFRAFCARLALKTCTHVIANHPALLSSENAYYDPSGHPEGIYKLIPGLATPASVIFNAVASPPPADLSQPRQKQILAVGTTPRLRDFYNKGFDLLTQVAGRRPDLRFVFVGIREQWLPELDRMFLLRELPNIRLASHLAHGQLLSLMKESAVYAQPSISEGMPNALMEAMLMGCVPVGSDVAGIPTVIGEYGFVFSRRDPNLLEAALDKALACDADRKAISAGIQERFSFEARKDKLLSLLNA